MDTSLKLPFELLILTQGQIANKCEEYYRECIKWLKVYNKKAVSKIRPISDASEFAIDAYNKFDFYFKGLKSGIRRSEYVQKRRKMSKKMLQTLFVK